MTEEAGLFASVLALAGPSNDRPGGALAIGTSERIVAIGDSITQNGGYLRAIEAVFAQQYPSLEVPEIINAGISGQKAEELVERFERDVIDRQPAVATINVGINDVWHRLEAPHDEAVRGTWRMTMPANGQHLINVALPRFAVSVLTGAVFYLVWMGAFILSAPEEGSLLRGLLWSTAPLVTAMGFATGSALFNRLRHLHTHSLGRLYLYPLTGCSIGAAAIFPFGPMLVVFGMCFMGSLSMVLYELVDARKRSRE